MTQAPMIEETLLRAMNDRLEQLMLKHYPDAYVISERIQQARTNVDLCGLTPNAHRFCRLRLTASIAYIIKRSGNSALCLNITTPGADGRQARAIARNQRLLPRLVHAGLKKQYARRQSA